MKKISEVKKWMVMSMVATAAIILHNAAVAAAEPQVPCLFIFGDSLIDNGNNNDMVSLAKATSLPYGIDFPEGPTGRFTNGKTTVDFISEFLGFDDYIPSYVRARGDQILRGVNYASAGAGIRPETGYAFGGRTYFAGQLNNFKNTIAQLTDILGDQETVTNYLSKCIYISEMGSNDFINNYFMPALYPTSRRYPLPTYVSLLISQYSDQLKVLYNYGARKVALIGALPAGCLPVELATSSPDGTTCVEKINQASLIFNQKLIELVDDLNTNFPAARFTYLDGYGPGLDVINNGSAYGFKVTNAACCGLGRNNATILCSRATNLCVNRDEYVFWDIGHPTQAAHEVFGKRVYKAEKPSDAYPFDISQLAQLQI